MELTTLLTVATVICFASWVAIVLSIRKIYGFQTAIDRMIEFRQEVSAARKRVTEIQRVATARAIASDTDGVIALTELHRAIQFAEKIIADAEKLIDERSSSSLQACSELFREPEEDEQALLGSEDKKERAKRFSARGWKSQVDYLIEQAESSILEPDVEEDDEQPMLAI